MFHVKDAVPDPSLPPREEMNEEQRQKLEMNRLQIMLEKKSFLNLLYAFSVALKHVSVSTTCTGVDRFIWRCLVLS